MTYSFIDESGETRLVGSISPAPGGVGAFTRSIIDVQETAGAGTYTGSLVIPAGAFVAQMAVYCLAAFAGTIDAASEIGDSIGGAGSYYNDLTGILDTPYDPTNGATMDGPGCVWLTQFGNLYKPAPFDWSNQSNRGGVGVPYASAGTITATVVTTGSGGTTGHWRVLVIGFGLPTTIVNAVKS